MKGNLVSTIFGSKFPLKTMAHIKDTKFLTGNTNGEIFTYNLENLKKNVPSLLT